MEKGRENRALGLLIALFLVAPAAQATAAVDAGNNEQTLVVGFQEEVPVNAADVMNRHGGDLVDVLERAQAVRVHVEDPASFAASVSARDDVVAVEPEATVTAQEIQLMDAYEFDLCCSGGGGGGGGYYYYSYDSDETAEEDGSPQTTVAIVDSGIDASHPNLTDNLWEHPETGSSGFDFVENDTVPDDEFGHGTHMAGFVQGAAPSTSIMSLKVMGPNGTGKVSDVAEGIEFAADHSADVILLSLGWSRLPSYPQTLLEDAIASATAQGANVVASAGNGGPVHAPASFQDVTAVAALQTHETDNTTTFSPATWASHGPQVDLAAAATGINSTISETNTLSWCGDNATHCRMSGSSVAAAPVAGAMAFLRSCRPTLTETQIDEILYRTANDVTSGVAGLGWDEATGHGNLNITAAVQHLVGCREPSSTSSGGGGVDEVIWSNDEEELVVEDGWTLSTNRSFSKDGAAWHVDVSNATPERNVLETPTIHVPDTGTTKLSFARWEDTESSSNHTLRQVRVTADGGASWRSLYKSVGEAPSTWVRERIQIPWDLEGESLKAQFVFEPNETRLAEHEGWYVDDVSMYTTGYDDPPVETTYESGTTGEGNCTSFQVTIDDTGAFQPGDTKAVDVELTSGSDTADIRVVSPDGQRTGSWTCGDHGVRNEIPSSAHSGADAETEWVRVAPVQKGGNWTVVVRSVLGTTDWTVAVEEHLVEEHPPQTVPYGDDTLLDTPDATYPSMNCTGDGSGCTYESSVDFSVWADANDTGEPESEVGSGFGYALTQACSAQSGEAAVELHPEAVVDFNHVNSDTGTYESSVHVRPGGLGDEPVVYATENNDAFVSAEVPTYDPSFSSAYEHVVSAYARAKTSVSVEDAYAKTGLDDTGLDLVFGDVTAPAIDASTWSSDDDPSAAGSGFLGWHQAPVNVSVEAFDPPGGNDEARSCLDRVTLVDTNATPAPTEVVVPGFYQPATAGDAAGDPYEVTYQDDKRYDLEVDAFDGNGTHANDTIAVSFGVDQHPPVTEEKVDPAEPNGENGWYVDTGYNDGRPHVYVDCSEPDGTGSGCDTVILREDDATNHSFSPTNAWWIGHSVPDGVHSYKHLARDVATNEGDWSSSFEVKVDLEIPAVNLSTDASPGPSSTWYPTNLTVNESCVDNVSGCANHTVTLDGSNVSGPFDVSGEGLHTATWSARDVAGNEDNDSRAFNVDLHDPNATSLLHPDDGAHTNAADVEVGWEAADDVGPSGVHHYRLFLDGAYHANVWDTTTTLSGLDEGTHCVNVRPVDRAGNVGPNATEHCFVVDRTKPSISFEVPRDEELINGSSSTQQVPGVASGQAWVIPRDLTFEVAASDGGLADLDAITIENGTSDDAPVTCSSSPCTRFFDNNLTEPWRTYPITVEAADTAGNLRTRDIDVRHTSVHVYSDYDYGADEWYVVVDWRPYTQSDFDEYRIYRDDDSTFDELDTEQIATVTDPRDVRYRDQPLDTEQDYYYWIEYVTTDGEVLRTYWWHAKTGSYDGSGGGGGGGGGDCDGLLGGCMEWEMAEMNAE